MSPLVRFGSDLTNTIRARGQQGPHQEAGHTTVPDQTATNSVPNPRLPIWGRPHTPLQAISGGQIGARRGLSAERGRLRYLDRGRASRQRQGSIQRHGSVGSSPRLRIEDGPGGTTLSYGNTYRGA